MLKTIRLSAVLLALMCSAVSSNEQAADKALWLATFYENRGTCVASGAQPEISADQTGIYVDLAANHSLLIKLSEISEEVVRDWLGLHCPIPFVVYEPVLKKQDIIIFSSTTPGVAALSCRDYDRGLRN